MIELAEGAEDIVNTLLQLQKKVGEPRERFALGFAAGVIYILIAQLGRKGEEKDG